MVERLVKIQAEPETVEVDLSRTAVIVVDMQNAFVSKGGMWDVRGVDVTKIWRVMKPIKQVLEAARNSAVKVIYIRHAYRPDLTDAGDMESPNYWKNPGLVMLRKNPSYREKIIIDGLWGSNIIDELKPLETDIVVTKPRYSGFANTDLDALLRKLNIKFLFFTGIATNICVESTIRDAFHKEYWPILIADCCMHLGPEYLQRATFWNIKRVFGWITNSKEFIQAVGGTKKS